MPKNTRPNTPTTKGAQTPPNDQSSPRNAPFARQSDTGNSPPGVPEVRVNEWEVWHTYATYLHGEAVNLEEAARSLVEAGIALCAMLRSGRTYWTSGSRVCSGNTTFSLDESGGTTAANMQFDAGCNETLDGFAAEACYQAGYFRHAEMRVFGEGHQLPSPYMRAFLGQCNLISTKDSSSKILLYPTLIVYESGVMILELRTIAPNHPIPLREFIVNHVNLFRLPFERIEAPPGLVKIATQAYYHSLGKWPVLYRAALLRLQRGHEAHVRQLTRHHDEGDFGFDLAPMSAEEGKEPSEKLSTFAQTVFHTAAFVISQPRTGFAFLIRGQKRIPLLGDFWSGRPHIHLVRFDCQCDTASENERRHKAAFRNILLRVPTSDSVVAKQELAEDCRFFDDYNAYITSAATLWVWSKSGINQQRKGEDPNRGHLIYEHQAVVETLGIRVHAPSQSSRPRQQPRQLGRRICGSAGANPSQQIHDFPEPLRRNHEPAWTTDGNSSRFPSCANRSTMLSVCARPKQVLSKLGRLPASGTP